jgi:hypothetical protein
MECPFCKQLMVKGAIQGSPGRTMTWCMEREENVWHRLAGYLWSANEQVISRGGYFKRSYIEGFKCNQCHKIIVDSIETQ